MLLFKWPILEMIHLLVFGIGMYFQNFTME